MQFIDEEIFLLAPNDYRVMPWKNGGGTTREILVHPSDTDDFDWRLSIADINTDGPFSAFPGYARTIMLLEGNGMRLQMDDAPPVEVTGKHRPVNFDGDSRTHCTLMDGPVRDFNIMTSKALASHRCQIIDTFPFSADISDDIDALAIFTLQGETRLHLSGTATVTLREHCTLLLAAPRRLRRVAATPESKALLISLVRTPS